MSGNVDRSHLERTAFVYIRQSTMKQVHEHRESQYNQFALVERARSLGCDLVLNKGEFNRDLAKILSELGSSPDQDQAQDK